MTKKSFPLRVAGLAMAVSATSFIGFSSEIAMAHHSSAMFDMRRIVEFKNVTVTEFQWVNPHSWLQVRIPNKNGKMVEWSLEMGQVAMLARSGWRRNTVRPGDKITVRLNPMRNGSPGGRLWEVVLPDGTTQNAWTKLYGPKVQR